MKTRILRLFCIPASLLMLAHPAHAQESQLELPAIFDSHMVLQRETIVSFWGRDTPGQTVMVRGSWANHAHSCSANSLGQWNTTLHTPTAGGPHKVVVQGSDTIVFEDVLIGEVWVCSGQSNMEWPMTATDHADEDIAGAKRPAIRLFDVGRKISMEPLGDVAGSWTACSPDNVSSFSAVGYFFGKALQEELDIPIGLIGSNWGGTPAEAWTSRESISQMKDFDGALAQIDASLSGSGEEKSLDDKRAEWWRGLENADPGYLTAWMRPGSGDDSWQEAAVPSHFRDVGHGDFDGCMWYRREFELPADWSDPKLVLELGPADDMDVVWLNGERIGSTKTFGHWQTPRVYSFPSGMARPGKNEIVVCVIDTGGGGSLGVAAGDPTPMRLRNASMEAGTGIALEGRWRMKPGAPMSSIGAYPNSTSFGAHTPTSLFNGMIAPLIPYAIRGAIWYQGESNRARAEQYRELFPTMIMDWRAHWGRGHFPFYFVQIAPFNYGGDTGEAAELREAQTLAMLLPNTGMAVTMDIGNPSDIHPRDKRTVGHRLALWALSETYGLKRPHSGPIYKQMQRTDKGIRLHFEHTAEGLVSVDGELTHFTIAGEDKVFHPAQASIDGNTVEVWSDKVSSPLSVRYAWGAADQPNLKNSAGLPAPSFRTDAW
ncbi:MAG: sialate O-acetylesterase [Planctomycetota bacterium]|jgi:sialate O-acetylesterase